MTSSHVLGPVTEAAVFGVGISKRYPGAGESEVVALANVSLRLDPGTFTAIMGPSGSGKSTLLHCLAGLDRPTSGEVWLGGQRVDMLSDKQLTALRRSSIGFVFQSFNLIPSLTARENIALPERVAGRAVDPAWLDEIVGRLGLSDRLNNRPAQLSGGQQQRVACVRALIGQPAVIFGDEPTGNLDSHNGGEVLEILRMIVDDYGSSVVMVTHDSLAASMADEVVFISDGTVWGRSARPNQHDIMAAMIAMSRGNSTATSTSPTPRPARHSRGGT